jgi:hypothetical protein
MGSCSATGITMIIGVEIMKDLLFVACTVGFFAVAIAYVWACDRLK